MNSTDARIWTERISSYSEQWLGVACGNNFYVSLTNSDVTNRAMSPSDGITWTARTPLSSGQYRGVMYGNNTFVLVSISGSDTQQIQIATWAIR